MSKSTVTALLAKQAAKQVISETISEGQQSVTLDRVLMSGENRLRISIKSDSYDFQCHATIKVWAADRKEWSLVHSIPYALMKTPAQLLYRKAMHVASTFEADASELLRVAIAVLA